MNHVQDIDILDEIADYEIEINQDTLFELVEPGTYNGLRSPSNAIGPFFVAEVNNQGKANESISDSFGHNILAGEKFAKVFYLQHHEQKKNMVKYQRPKKQRSVNIRIAGFCHKHYTRCRFEDDYGRVPINCGCCSLKFSSNV